MTIATKDYCYKIYRGDSPGLFQLNHHGYYGEYIRYEVVYADLCCLFGFVVYQNPNIYNDYKFPRSEVDGESVDIYLYEQKIESSIKTVKV